MEYRVGRFTLHPRRQLLQDGACVSIGRKALELLSALAEAEGALVTKDELMAAVWPTAIVEENAIQVHIAALRKVLGADAELLRTVRGLGYRLSTAAVDAAATPRSAPPTLSPAPEHAPIPVPLGGRPHRRSRTSLALPWRVVLAASGLALGVAALGLWLVGVHTREQRSPIGATFAVAPFEAHNPDGAVREFADDLVETVSSALSNDRQDVVSGSPSRAGRNAGAERGVDQPRTDFLLTGAVTRDASTYDVHVHLVDALHNVVVWSDEFRGAASTPGALQTRVAAHMADAALWAAVSRSRGARLAPSTLAAFIAGREATIGIRGDAAAMADYQKVVAAAPDFSWGRSAIAVTNGFDLLAQPDSPAARLLRVESRREAWRALRLDPHNGEAYLALDLLSPPFDWRGREGFLMQGAAADPGFEPVAMMEGRLLWGVGRSHEATAWLQKAHDLDPLHNGATWSLAVNLASEGLSSRSKVLLAQMAAQWPDHGATKDAEFWTSLLSGTTQHTLTLLADAASWPPDMDLTAAEAWRAALKATGSERAAARARARERVVSAAKVGSLDHGEAMILLILLGDLDDGFAQARLYQAGDPFAPPYLFLPIAAPLRADRRFMPLARRLGLVDYWRSTARWPDFCNEPGLSYDCRAQALRSAG